MNFSYLDKEIIPHTRTTSIVSCMLAALIVVISTSTFVSGQDPELLIIGSHGNGTGQFNNPGRIAVDPSGNLFVADLGNARIQKFDANGKLITMWGTHGSAQGEFNRPSGMTVQYPSGNVFVVDTGNSRIQEFDNNGKFIKAVDIARQFDASDNIDLDVDANGKLYITDRDDDRIVILTS
jgi:tripartite motif-containing protein 71